MLLNFAEKSETQEDFPCERLEYWNLVTTWYDRYRDSFFWYLSGDKAQQEVMHLI